MARTRTLLSLAATAALLPALGLGGCDPYDPELGDQPFLCGNGDPKCPAGYGETYDTIGRCICQEGVKPIDGGLIPGDDGGGGGFVCAADPNDPEGGTNNNSTASATRTPVGNGSTTWVGSGLAICPSADLDYYSLSALTGQQLDVTLMFDTARSVLALSILSVAGTPVAAGQPQENGAKATYDVTTAGTYYVQVGASEGLTNNYSINILLR